MVIFLTLGYVAVAALLLNVAVSSRWSTVFKVSAIVLVSTFYFVSYFAWRSITGMPSTEALPEDFRVLWVSIDEPNKRSAENGGIYIWLRKLDEDTQMPVSEPRAFRLPYSVELAEDIELALRQLEEGKQLNGRRSRQQVVSPEEQDDLSKKKPAQITGESGSQTPGVNDFRIVFREIPLPDLPPKPAL